jgi:hypothetical protein
VISPYTHACGTRTSEATPRCCASGIASEAELAIELPLFFNLILGGCPGPDSGGRSDGEWQAAHSPAVVADANAASFDLIETWVYPTAIEVRHGPGRTMTYRVRGVIGNFARRRLLSGHNPVDYRLITSTGGCTAV